VGKPRPKTAPIELPITVGEHRGGVVLHDAAGTQLIRTNISAADAIYAGILAEMVNRIPELEAENEKLRKILAHVPAKAAIEAKEAAGFPEHVKASERSVEWKSS